MLNGILLIVLVGSSGWVFVDARRLGAKRGVLGGGFLDSGAGAWFFASLLLWVIAIPCYLVTRPKLVAAKARREYAARLQENPAWWPPAESAGTAMPWPLQPAPASRPSPVPRQATTITTPFAPGFVAQPGMYASPATYPPPQSSAPMPGTTVPPAYGTQAAPVRSNQRLLLFGLFAVVAATGIYVGVHPLFTHKPGTANGTGFNNPATLAADLQDKVNERLSDPSSQYYVPGASATAVDCVLESGHTFTCLVNLSTGASESDDVVVSPDGSSYISK